MLLSPRAFASLTKIYDAAMDMERWPEALDATTASVGAKGGTLLVAERAADPYRVTALSGAFDGVKRSGEIFEYVKDLSHYEAPEWEMLRRLPAHRPLLDTDIWPDAEALDERPDFRFFRQKLGMRRRLAVRLNENPAWYDAMTFNFGAEHLVLPEGVKDEIAPLLPHLAKAVEIGRAFAQLRAKYAAVLSVLDRVHVGLAIALASGEIIVANTETERISDLADGLVLNRDRRLVLRDPSDTAALQAGITEAALTAGGRGNRSANSYAVDRPSGAHPFLIEVAPVADSARELDIALSGAVVTIIDPENAPVLDIEKFARLHGLTRAETAVCRHMIEGLTGPVIAEMRSTSPQTVKTQITSVLAKTGAARRSELIRLVVRTLPPIG